jgi:uncharacterized protein
MSKKKEPQSSSRTTTTTTTGTQGKSYIQIDWEQREWAENVNTNLKKVVDFLNKFELATRFRLAKINEKLTILERQMDFLEAQMGRTSVQEQQDT